MQIVGVAGVHDSHMAAGESVLMAVLLMLGAYVHRDPPGCEGIAGLGCVSPDLGHPA
jgi:hypothetical protein